MRVLFLLVCVSYCTHADDVGNVEVDYFDSDDDNTTSAPKHMSTVPTPAPGSVDLRCRTFHSCSVNGDFLARCIRGACSCSTGYKPAHVGGVVVPLCMHSEQEIESMNIGVQFRLQWAYLDIQSFDWEHFDELTQLVDSILGQVKGRLVISLRGTDIIGVADVSVMQLERLDSFESSLREGMTGTSLSAYSSNFSSAIYAGEDCPPVVGVLYQVPDPSGGCVPTQCSQGYSSSQAGTRCELTEDSHPFVSAPRVVGFIVGSLALLVVIGFILTCTYRSKGKGNMQGNGCQEKHTENTHLDTTRSMVSLSSFTQSQPSPRPMDVVLPPILKKKDSEIRPSAPLPPIDPSTSTSSQQTERSASKASALHFHQVIVDTTKDEPGTPPSEPEEASI